MKGRLGQQHECFCSRACLDVVFLFNPRSGVGLSWSYPLQIARLRRLNIFRLRLTREAACD